MMLRKNQPPERQVELLESFQKAFIALAEPLNADADEYDKNGKRYEIAVFYNKYYSKINELKAAANANEKYFVVQDLIFHANNIFSNINPKDFQRANASDVETEFYLIQEILRNVNLICQFQQDFEKLDFSPENIANLYDKYHDKIGTIGVFTSSEEMQELVAKVKAGFELIDQQKQLKANVLSGTSLPTEAVIENMDKSILDKLKEIFEEIAKFFQEVPNTFRTMVSNGNNGSNDLGF